MAQLGGTGNFLSGQDAGLSGRESLADVARVISGYSDAVVLLNNFSNEIGSLAGAGLVRNANSGTTAATLTTGGDDTSTIFSGTIQNGGGGALSLTKTGSGTQTMTGISNYTGAFDCINGYLFGHKKSNNC